MNKEEQLGALIQSFLAYRDMLAPVVENLQGFITSYDSLRHDVDTINKAFAGDVEGKLAAISDTLAKQATASSELSGQIERFVNMGNRYVRDIEALSARLGEVEKRLSAMDELEARASEQLAKLDTIMAEKKSNYNIRDLQRTIESYGNSIGKVSDFINHDVADVLKENNSRLDGIRSISSGIANTLGEEGKDVRALFEQVKTNNDLLVKLLEKGDVDEAYLYDILDHWAQTRGVKLKK